MTNVVLGGLLLFLAFHIFINIISSNAWGWGLGFKTFSSFNAFTIGINNAIVTEEKFYIEEFTIGLFVLEINLYFYKQYSEKDLKELAELNNQIS